MGPVQSTMPKSGGGGARTELAERKIVEMDQLEIAFTHSEQEKERQPANPEEMELEHAPLRADKCGPHPSHTELARERSTSSR